jgi:peptidylprolyl isomerase
MPEQVKNGDTVRVHYTGRLEDGQVFDSSEGGDALEFRVGAGEVIPGFDDAVRDMGVGDKKTVRIEADDAYGQRRDQLVAQVPRESMNLDSPPEEGMSLVMQLQDGNQIPVTVTEVTDTHVTLDANHPLAGHDLTFDVELVGHEPE